MKKIYKYLPFCLSILLIAYSIYVYTTIHGFKIFEQTSSMGMFYALTYKYSAAAGTAVFIIYIVLFITKLRHKGKAE